MRGWGDVGLCGNPNDWTASSAPPARRHCRHSNMSLGAMVSFSNAFFCYFSLILVSKIECVSWLIPVNIVQKNGKEFQSQHRYPCIAVAVALSGHAKPM